jgi:hypothetical protein
MNIMAVQQCLQIKHTTGNTPGKHVSVGQCCFEAESAGVTLGQCYFWYERPLNHGWTVLPDSHYENQGRDRFPVLPVRPCRTSMVLITELQNRQARTQGSKLDSFRNRDFVTNRLYRVLYVTAQY